MRPPSRSWRLAARRQDNRKRRCPTARTSASNGPSIGMDGEPWRSRHQEIDVAGPARSSWRSRWPARALRRHARRRTGREIVISRLHRSGERGWRQARSRQVSRRVNGRRRRTVDPVRAGPSRQEDGDEVGDRLEKDGRGRIVVACEFNVERRWRRPAPTCCSGFRRSARRRECGDKDEDPPQ